MEGGNISNDVLNKLDIASKLSILDFADERERVSLDSLIESSDVILSNKIWVEASSNGGMLVRSFDDLLGGGEETGEERGKRDKLSAFLFSFINLPHGQSDAEHERPEPFIVGRSFSSPTASKDQLTTLRDVCMKGVAKEAEEMCGDLEKVEIGRMGDKQTSWQCKVVRGDRVTWIHRQGGDGSSHPHIDTLLDRVESLRQRINEIMGEEYLVDFEAQLACHAGNGSRFAPHVDATAQSHSRRVLTLVVYINSVSEWDVRWGGEVNLRVSEAIYSVLPKRDRFVLFPSHSLEHSVSPSYSPRYSIAVWFRRSSE